MASIFSRSPTLALSIAPFNISDDLHLVFYIFYDIGTYATENTKVYFSLKYFFQFSLLLGK
jgi:hypothetical protein